MDLNTLIAECTAYDYKESLEEKKPKSWLKSVSAFANTLGGSLFFGVDNDGNVKGLDDIQHVTETISMKIRDYMDPLPDVEMIPLEQEGKHVLQLKVKEGLYTPYYYVGDGQRVAFVRNGDESLPATGEQMVRLVLKGTNRTYDSLRTDKRVEDYSFAILANTFKERVQQDWDKKYLLSFGLVTDDGYLTNAGALFADDCWSSQSRLYCTRWYGLEKSDAINDAEYKGNILLLLREAMNFVKSNTKKGWEKLPDGRKNKPEYAERAVLEAMVNHFIHRDYTVMGGEVHLDIYDDRIAVTSPGGMYSGQQVQDVPLEDISSLRRNPVLADVMALTVIYSMEYEEETTEKTTEKVDEFNLNGKEPARSWQGVGKELGVDFNILKDIADFCVEAHSLSEIAEHLGLSDRYKMKKKYIDPLLGKCFDMTIPNSPNNPGQKYYLTELGKALL